MTDPVFVGMLPASRRRDNACRPTKGLSGRSAGDGTVTRVRPRASWGS